MNYSRRALKPAADAKKFNFSRCYISFFFQKNKTKAMIIFVITNSDCANGANNANADRVGTASTSNNSDINDRVVQGNTALNAGVRSLLIDTTLTMIRFG
jgi:hypothetical protein